MKRSCVEPYLDHLMEGVGYEHVSKNGGKGASRGVRLDE